MPEFRQDIVTKRWVILAQERAKRPEDFREPVQTKRAHHVDSCPFCAGNEDQTPPELHRVSAPSGWRVRTVPNKFPALTMDGDVVEGQVGIFRTMSGVGSHEVVIESPDHDASPATLSVDHLADVIRSYIQRYHVLCADERLQYIQIFRNHRKLAGASLEHPHSQLIAMPFVPRQVQAEMDAASEHWKHTGECVYCRMIRGEIRATSRVVCANDMFVAVCPFASRVPFETWILPLQHQASFGQLADSAAQKFAGILRCVLNGLASLNDPAYNYMVHTAPIGPDYADAPHLHWRMEILPKLSTTAGFELGTGVFINVSTPEDAARFLRTAASST